MYTDKKNKKKHLALKKNESGILKYPYLIIFAFLLLTYFQVAGFDFVYLDDDLIILDNYDKISSLENVGNTFTTQYGFNQGTPYYRPMTMVSFIIDAQFSHKNPTGYHISNLIFHFLTSILFFKILLKLDCKKIVALSITLIFVVHPLLTNAVVWIVGRNDLLAAIFCLASFLSLIQFFNSQEKKYLIAHSGFYLIAVFSKEVSIVLPLVCVLYIFWFFRNNLRGKITFNLLILWAIPIVIYLLLRHNYVAPVKNVAYGLTPFLSNVPSIADIISKIFIPINLAVLPTFSLFRIITGGLFILLLTLIPLFFSTVRKKNYYFGLIWFLVFTLPGLLILYSNQTERFEYLDTRVYLPMIGILISVSELFRVREINLYKIGHILKGLAVIISLAVLTIFQSMKYKNAIVFAESAVESNPEKAFFYQKLGDYYFTKNDYSKAAEYLEKTVEKAPNNYVHYKNLSLAYYYLGNNQKTLHYLEKAYQLNPKDFNVLSALIKVNYKLHRYKEAFFFANKVIEFGGSVDQKLYEDLKLLQE